jgi:tRNA-dihydrouridine synthase 1
MDQAEADAAAKAGGLVGMGCEEHESKVRARGERAAIKRKNGREGRREARAACKADSGIDTGVGEGKSRRLTKNTEVGTATGVPRLATACGKDGDEEERFLAGLTS